MTMNRKISPVGWTFMSTVQVFNFTTIGWKPAIDLCLSSPISADSGSGAVDMNVHPTETV